MLRGNKIGGRGRCRLWIRFTIDAMEMKKNCAEREGWVFIREGTMAVFPVRIKRSGNFIFRSLCLSGNCEIWVFFKMLRKLRVYWSWCCSACLSVL